MKDEKERIKVVRFPRQLKRFSLFLTTAPAALVGYIVYRLIGKKVDLIHGHGHLPSLFHFYKLAFGWLDKTPYYFQLHITAAGRQVKNIGPVDSWTKYFEWPLHKLSDRIGIKVAQRVLCTSESVKQEAITYYHANPEKMVVVGSGVNIQLFSLKTQDSKPQIPRRLLFVGQLNSRKQPEVLIRTLKHLPKNYRLTIVGSGPTAYLQKLKKLVANLNLKGQITFEDQIPYLEMPPFYQKADILVLPSKYEGFPKAVLEALACGTPAICGGFKTDDQIGQFITLIDSFFPPILAKQIKEVLEESREDGLVAQDFVQENYSWEAVAQRTETAYEKPR